MRVLVTGGAGFIGSHIADALVARGDDVTVIDDLSRGRREQVSAGANLVEFDITDEGLRHVVSKIKPEIIIHEAAQIDVRRSVREPLFDTTTNVVGTVNILQSGVEAGAKRIVFASSGGALYGDTEVMPTPETHPCLPASNYGAAKLCGEVYGRTFSHMYGLEFVALRYANVYGPRQDPHGEAGVVAIFAQRLLSNREAIVNGDGLQTRDYVYVSDVVDANVAALTGKPGAYNIGTGAQNSVNDIYSAIASACGNDEEPKHGPAKPGEQMHSCLDIALAREELGWSPKVMLQEGITKTVDHFRAGTRSASGASEAVAET